MIANIVLLNQYARFWDDPSSAHIHWIALLFMLLSLGVHFNRFQVPSEVEADSPLPPTNRIKQYKSCAGLALIWGKYMQPTEETIPAFLLYVESEFLLNRATQMQCYVLSAVLLRLMLKMGLHRDPSGLANISTFDGEMRRRAWHMALQVETIVAFHMGLPAMGHSIEFDTQSPRNLLDEDFDVDTLELPPARPSTDWTPLAYPLNKTAIVNVFAEIARQAHVLTPPSYSEVLRLDVKLQETWGRLPAVLHVRPLNECVGVAPILLIQRFGLASIYNKSRCVLHRRYLTETKPRREHDYSRHQALQGATTLLNFQGFIYEGSRPGHVMSQSAWFITSLSVHDYLLAAVIVYLVIRNDHYNNPDSEYNWNIGYEPTPTKDELKHLIKRSQEIWADVAKRSAEVKKTADTLAVMISKLGLQPANSTTSSELSPASKDMGSTFESAESSSIPHSTLHSYGSNSNIPPSADYGGMARRKISFN
jgi:hypothetical protein